VPAFAKVYSARARVDRNHAGLRCVEAIRLHDATHGGKLPRKLADITGIPLPTDPITGQGMDAWFHLERDGTGVLEVPPPPATPTALLGRRYELRADQD
jgi:hypothetical protein